MTTSAVRQVSQLARGLIGRPAKGDLKVAVIDSARPAADGTVQVITIASGAPANSTAYTLRVQDAAQALDETITYTTDSSGTAAEVEAGFEAAWLANAVLRGVANATDASGDLVVTCRDYRTDLTITGGDSASIALFTITETTAPSAAPTHPIGRWVQLAAGTGRLGGQTYADITPPTQAAVAATITSDASGAYSLVVTATNASTGEQEVKTVSWAGNATPATTYANAETAFEAAFAGTGFVGSTASNVVTLTAPVGWDLSASSVTVSGGSAALTVAVTQPGALPDIAFVADPENESPATLGGAVTDVSAGRIAPVVLSSPGVRWGVEASGATPTYGGTVYIETAAGANNGRPYTVQSATGSRMALPKSRSKWESVDPTDTDVHYVLGV